MKCFAPDDEGKNPCQLDINHDGHHDHGGHRWSLRVNGLRRCYECDKQDYDPYWGAGLFNDWPRGTTKPYGA